MKIQAQKFKLEQDIRRELKLYFTIARPANLNIPNESVQATLAYSLESAITMAKQGIPSNFFVVYHGQSVGVKELLGKIHLEQKKVLLPTQKRHSHSQATDTQKLGKEAFRAGLMLAADKFIKGKDKKVLKKIIKKI